MLQLLALSIIMYMVAVLPLLISRGMPFFYYGDYNVQQIPFYTVAQRAIKSGNLFYLWNMDFGGSLIGSFSFYLLGSPFFWLSVPFPEQTIPYIMPFLMALKYGVCSMTAYAYIRRRVSRDESAMIGALLYAFSGFNACNIVFNHFTDVVAFFPLYLLLFEKLMEIDHHKDHWFFIPGGRAFVLFTLMTTLMAVINYYFFFGEVVFLILYFIVCYTPGNRKMTIIRMFFRALFGGTLGVLIGGFYILQAALGVSGNNRLSDVLLGYDTVSYKSMNMLWDILKSMVMIPDIIGKGTVFYTDPVKNASLAVFLPLFGLSGVIAYFMMNKKKHDAYARFILVCLLIACIPILNSVFSIFNEHYYARWFYMPILIMATMTAKAAERGNTRELKRGTLITCFIFLIIILISILPSYNDYGEVVMMDLILNKNIYWRDVIGTAVIMLMLIISVFAVPKCIRKIKAPFTDATLISLNKPIMRTEIMFVMTAIASIISLHIVLTNGSSLINDFGKHEWEEQMLRTAPQLDDKDEYFRVETDKTATNYDMYWGYSSLHSFISTIPHQSIDFLNGTEDIERTVETNIPAERIGLRAILSNKYYFENSLINDEGYFENGDGIKGFFYRDSQNGIDIYRNMNYIPMGFTYDYFIRQSEWESIKDSEQRDRLLSVALILSDEDADKNKDIISELSPNYYIDELPIDVFEKNCKDRADSSCNKFITDTNGFYAMTSNLKEDKLMFFSVPYLKGFSVLVDGRNTEIIKADYGMMAIRIPAGVHEIKAFYRPDGFYPGLIMSLVGIIVLTGYLLAVRFYKKR